MTNAARTKRANGAGQLRQLPSGRWQAKFRGSDGLYRPAPSTFDTKMDANAWLQRQTRDIRDGSWEPPLEVVRVGSLREYGDRWLTARPKPLKPATFVLYRDLLRDHVYPVLGDLRLDKITPATVRAWYATLDPERPTRRAHAYSLLRAIMSTAVADELVQANPCRIKGAGQAEKRHETKVATLDELEVIVAALPARYRAMALLAAWCGLRQGELFELRRGDVDLDEGVVYVRRGVTRVDGVAVVGTPKSRAGIRRVAIPPHLLPAIEGHLSQHTGPASDALLFAARHGGHMVPGTLYRVWYRAREAAGRPDLRFHDLRHTGATYAAAAGATLAELMQRIGHSTPAAALKYQHAAQDRDQAIAAALSDFATQKVVALRPARRA